MEQLVNMFGASPVDLAPWFETINWLIVRVFVGFLVAVNVVFALLLVSMRRFDRAMSVRRTAVSQQEMRRWYDDALSLRGDSTHDGS